VSDYRRVQCFGTKRRPRKADEPCRKQFLWIARGASGNFGRKGAQACPNCGTLPNFDHPYNKFLSGDITHEQAVALMPEYTKSLEESK
jgi:hypothetical protein